MGGFVVWNWSMEDLLNGEKVDLRQDLLSIGKVDFLEDRRGKRWYGVFDLL